MLWFGKIETGEKAPSQNSHANSTAERLVRTELEYAAAERVWNTAFQKLKNYIYAHRDREPFAIGHTMFMPLNHRPNVERGILVHEESMARTKRGQLLQERAELRKSLGLSR